MPKYLSHAERYRRDEMFREGKLYCTKCKRFLPHQSFGAKVRNGTNYGYFHHCLHCRRASQWKSGDYDSRKRRKTERYRELKSKYVRIAGGQCQRCGYDESYFALHFHHVNPTEKGENPTKVINSGDDARAFRELDKCCLLCANCHQSFGITWSGEFKKRDGLGYTVESEFYLEKITYVSVDLERASQLSFI